jgi:hypothetical protein
MMQYSLGAKIGSAPFIVLMKTSEVWTCLIVTHVYRIVSSKGEIDERKYERRY